MGRKTEVVYSLGKGLESQSLVGGLSKFRKQDMKISSCMPSSLGNFLIYIFCIARWFSNRRQARDRFHTVSCHLVTLDIWIGWAGDWAVNLSLKLLFASQYEMTIIAMQLGQKLSLLRRWPYESRGPPVIFSRDFSCQVVCNVMPISFSVTFSQACSLSPRMYILVSLAQEQPLKAFTCI